MAAHIEPLYVAGLNGRMLRLPAKKPHATEFLIIGGHHTSIERMYALAEVFNRFGAVTMPDLPGFGGMQPFYKIGIEPTIDNYADYLASFIKLKYNRKKVVLVGFSYSVPVIIRTLQKYPELSSRVLSMISIVGFVHKEDFKLPNKYITLLKIMSAVGSNAAVSFFFKHFVVRRMIIRSLYLLASNINPKMASADKKQLNERINFEIKLWLDNDLRTWFKTTGEMFSVNLLENRIHTPLHVVLPSNDIYFDHQIVEQHMRVICEDVTAYSTEMPNHVPSVVADVKEIEPFFPPKLKKYLLSL